MNMFRELHTDGANELIVFGHLKNAESTPGNRSMPRVLELPATERSPGAA